MLQKQGVSIDRILARYGKGKMITEGTEYNLFKEIKEEVRMLQSTLNASFSLFLF